jgi:antitoxin component of MazEF toxin-antitoxin module
MRKSGHSLVVTIPIKITQELDLKDGDSVWWSIQETGLFMHIEKFEPPELPAEELPSLKKDEEQEGDTV